MQMLLIKVVAILVNFRVTAKTSTRQVGWIIMVTFHISFDFLFLFSKFLHFVCLCYRKWCKCGFLCRYRHMGGYLLTSSCFTSFTDSGIRNGRSHVTPTEKTWTDTVYEIMVCLAKLGLIMAYTFLCDR